MEHQEFLSYCTLPKGAVMLPIKGQSLTHTPAIVFSKQFLPSYMALDPGPGVLGNTNKAAAKTCICEVLRS